MLTIIDEATNRDVVSLAAVKLELGIENSSEDADLRAWITGASAVIESYCGRVFVVETVEESFRNIERDALSLARYPLVAVNSITENGTALAPSDAEIDFASGILYRLKNDRRAAWCASSLVVEYESGYETIPPVVSRACMSLVALTRSKAERDPLLKSLEIPEVATETFWVGSTPGEPGAALPADVAAMLSRFVVRRLAAA